jgi:hypothetical protein
MRRRAAGILACGIWFAAVESAHDVITTQITFSREISRVVYNRCVRCHRTGGVAFSLATYAEARPWAAAIKEEVLERRMPPWGAVKGFGDFRDEQGLTQEEIGLIADWVEGGAPEGDAKLLPKIPQLQRERPANLQASIPVEGALTLKTGTTITGIRPQRVPDDGCMVVTARRPDGTVEPLLWLYHYKSRFPQTYRYKSELHLEAATTIEVTPPGAGAVALLTKVPPGRAHK